MELFASNRAHGLWKSLTPRLSKLAIACAALSAFATTGQLHGQETHVGGRYFPLHQNLPPGTAAYWTGATRRVAPNTIQPIRIELPSTGDVAFFVGGRAFALKAPAQVGAGVGYTYRLKVGGMPEFPGIEVYPSIEILDGLHPPAGRVDDFPIPIPLGQDEIESALNGRLVTKVIYLEDPRFAPLRDPSAPMPVYGASPDVNLLVESDRLGRPMAIVRLGGRLPAAQGGDQEFFGNGGPLVPSPSVPSPKTAQIQSRDAEALARP